MARGKLYSDEFKKQIVALHNNGKAASEILKEYGIARASLYKWVNEYNKTSSFKAKDNRTDEENDIIRLRKENQQLKMENDILKQAALIMGRK